MQPQEFYIPTTWRIKGTAEQVYDVLSNGDLDGRGEWHFRQDGEWVVVRYDWTVLATKPWMLMLAPLLKPVLVWNHKWAMQRGLEGLTRELARRAAA